MTYISILWDSKYYYLMEQPNGTYCFTDEQPPFGDDIPAEITFSTEDGNLVTINTDNEFIVNVVGGFVAEGQSYHGSRMIDYYPQAIKSVLEFQSVICAHGFEIDFLRCGLTCVLNDAWLPTMGEDRIIQWERLLEIVPGSDETLDERRRVVIARLLGRFKLNRKSIATIVKTLIDGECNSYFQDSCIYVEIRPPEGYRDLTFPKVYDELMRRKPAHIGLNIYRWFARWMEIKNNFGSWYDVYNSFNSWQDVRFYSGVTHNRNELPNQGG